MKTWRDHTDAKEQHNVLDEYDDGSAVCMASYSGGGSDEGAWGALSIMKIDANGITKFRRFAASGDWFDPDTIQQTS